MSAAAEPTYQQEYARRVLGRSGGDLTAVLDHMALLAESGVSLNRLAAVTGLDYSGLWRLCNGVSRSVTSRSAEKILAVDPTDAADSGSVPFDRLEGVALLLESRGWTRNQMAAAVGSRHFPRRDRSRITVRVLRLYAGLLDLPPKAAPDLRAEAQRDGWRQRKAASRAAERGTPVAADPEPDTWRDQAACHREGSTMLPVFFSNEPRDINRAKAVCRMCPVQTECLSWAIGLPEREDFGTAGGLSEDERRAERNRRRRGQA